MLRKARMVDAKSIQQLINHFANGGEMLGISMSEVYETIRSFYVVEKDGDVIGTVRLAISWDDLAEIRSLAVAENAAGQGVGRQLVEACLAEARGLGIQRLFALTYKPDFFFKFGFSGLDKAELPQKIWRDCIHCAKFPDCDETAVQLRLDK